MILDWAVLAAAVAIVVGLARALGAMARAPLLLASAYALGALVAAFVALAAWGPRFQVAAFVFGGAFAAGMHLGQSERASWRAPLRVHVASGAIALAYAGAFAWVAVAYTPWMAVGGMVAAIVATLLVWLTSTPPAPAWVSARPAQVRLPATLDGLAEAARGLQEPGPPAELPVACPQCGLAGQVSATRAGQTLPCPRCRSPVRVPRHPARPVRTPVPPLPGLGKQGPHAPEPAPPAVAAAATVKPQRAPATKSAAKPAAKRAARAAARPAAKAPAMPPPRRKGTGKA